MTTKELEAALAAQEGKRPQAYSSPWQAALEEAMGRILNRAPFQYNLNGDALYRQYRDQAVQDGRRAMQDTVGHATALTGGYGNSYAQAAGQQAYSRELEHLADRIPELYSLALEQYRQQTQDMQLRYDLLYRADDRDYGRYRDALAAWQKDADRLQSAYQSSRDYDYGVYRDTVADWKWRQDFDENVRRYNQEWDDKHPQIMDTPTASPKKRTEKELTPGKKSGGDTVTL